MLDRKIENGTIVYRSGNTPVLTVLESLEETGVLIKLTGELRSDVAHDMLDELTAIVTSGAQVSLDFSGVTYIANAVQEVLVTVQQNIETIGVGAMQLQALPAPILQEFESTGIIDCLDIV